MSRLAFVGPRPRGHETCVSRLALLLGLTDAQLQRFDWQLHSLVCLARHHCSCLGRSARASPFRERESWQTESTSDVALAIEVENSLLAKQSIAFNISPFYAPPHDDEVLLLYLLVNVLLSFWSKGCVLAWFVLSFERPFILPLLASLDWGSGFWSLERLSVTQ